MPIERKKNPDPDAEAVAKALAGDRKALSSLLRGLQLRVYRFILRQAASSQDAEDLTQETFIEVQRKLASFQGNARFSTWVLGIAQNIVRNYRNRAPIFRHPTVSDDVLDHHADTRAGPHEQLMTDARLRALQDGMERFLTPELREALLLISLEGLDYGQAATILNIPLGTVKTRVFRARRLLRDGLKQEKRMELFKMS